MNSDTRYMSKEFITEFINIYRSHPCLWQVKSKDYTNKCLKNRAYGELVRFSKGTVPEANTEFVRKKIQNLRAAFRKELNKVEASKRNCASMDEVYEPSLWYYSLLSFTIDTEEAWENADETSFFEVQNVVKEELYIEDEGQAIEQSPKTVNLQVHSESADTLPSCSKGKRLKESEFTNTPLNKIDEYDAIGINVAAKLRKMDGTQALLAEHIINKVLFKGMFKQLTFDATVTERARNLNYARPSPTE